MAFVVAGGYHGRLPGSGREGWLQVGDIGRLGLDRLGVPPLFGLLPAKDLADRAGQDGGQQQAGRRQAPPTAW